MKRRFVISDQHFAHDNCYRFTRRDGTRLRPWAENAAQADEMMIDAWNAVVRPGDTVYHLGDVSIRKTGLSLLDRLHGRKVLIRGNHDIFKLKDYAAHFADIRGTHKLGSFVLSHYPLHPDHIPPWCSANIHGHIHADRVMKRTWWGRRHPDPRYFNACVEIIGLAPLDIEDVAARIIPAKRGLFK